MASMRVFRKNLNRLDDIDIAVAAYKSGWVVRVVLTDDGDTEILEVELMTDWQKGPSEFVQWASENLEARRVGGSFG